VLLNMGLDPVSNGSCIGSLIPVGWKIGRSGDIVGRRSCELLAKPKTGHIMGVRTIRREGTAAWLGGVRGTRVSKLHIIR